MIWINIRENPPPEGKTVLIGIEDSFFLGSVDRFNRLRPVNTDYGSIPLSEIWWTPILPVPKKPK